MVMASRGPLLRPSRAPPSPITTAQPRHHIRGNHLIILGRIHTGKPLIFTDRTILVPAYNGVTWPACARSVRRRSRFHGHLRLLSSVGEMSTLGTVLSQVVITSALSMLGSYGCKARPRCIAMSSNAAQLKAGGAVQYCDEETMAPKAHGTSDRPVQIRLRWGVDHVIADRICNFNRDQAEYRGYWRTEARFLQEVSRDEPTVYYDSVTGAPLFMAPVGRTLGDFLVESERHGWPSFRDDEVIWANVRVLHSSGEVVSTTGTHLGHNLPDANGNRHCINICSIAGQPPGAEEGRGEESQRPGATQAWELETSLSLVAGLRACSSHVPPLDLLVDLHDAQSGLCSEGVWHNAWLGAAYVYAARRLRRAGEEAASEAQFAWAVELADSMYDLSFDEGFRKRTCSGIWQSAESAATALEAKGERVAFYTASTERRSAQNGAPNPNPNPDPDPDPNPNPNPNPGRMRTRCGLSCAPSRGQRPSTRSSTRSSRTGWATS